MTHRYDEPIAADLAERFASHLVTPTPIENNLFELTSAAVALVDGVDCADILMVDGGDYQSIAATSPIATTVDQAQKSTREGPCLDAAERDVIVRCNDLRDERRWPEFTSAALAAGVRSVMSIRLYTDGSDSGALNLFGFEPSSFSAEPEALAVMLATHAAAALIAANRHRQFESALASRDLIGQAKGLIMERFGVDAMRAFQLLTKLSQDSNTPVRTVAERLTGAAHKP